VLKVSIGDAVERVLRSLQVEKKGFVIWCNSQEEDV